jgi:hypothetical protein
MVPIVGVRRVQEAHVMTMMVSNSNIPIRPSSIHGRFQAQINGIRKNLANYTNDFQKLALRWVLETESVKIEEIGSSYNERLTRNIKISLTSPFPLFFSPENT